MDNYRAPVLMEPSVLGGTGHVMRTPLGNVRTTQGPPPLPPPIQYADSSNYGSYMNSYGHMGGGYGSFLPYGNSFNGYSNYGGVNYCGFGGGMNRFGSPYDPENRFIQLAEENSRPAFESIESLVSAVANIASMLDSTFFAITSSFRAILGVAANFGRLRGVFSQFWQTFAIFRGLTWLYRKIMFWLRLSNIDPSNQIFKEAFAAAENAVTNGEQIPIPYKRSSPWPVIVFLSFIFTAPYLVMKLLGNLTSSAINETKDPRHWIKPIKSVVLYDFHARNPYELSVKSGDVIFIAPKEIQNTQKLLKTGWAIATLDGQRSGIIPISYVQRSERENDATINQNTNEQIASTKIFPELSPEETLKITPTTTTSMQTNEIDNQIPPSIPDTNSFTD